MDRVHTVSSIRPKTDALDSIVLSMKLNIYVMNKRGMSRISTLRNVLEAMTWALSS